MYARQLWQRLETLHAVTYFAEESVRAAREAGLKGFWMGYFGFRASPMGAVSAGTVEAVFANFAPAMVQRSIPDAWDHASPVDLVEARGRSAAAALRRLVPGIDELASHAVAPLERVAAAAGPIGRPLFASNATLAAPEDPVARLWQVATVLREYRGDGHVHVLSLAGLDGCEAHRLHAAEFGTPDEVLRDNRGWTRDEWAAAGDRLVGRGLFREASLTAAGLELRHAIEADTDRLAAIPIDAALPDAERPALLERLTRPAGSLVESGTIPFPNPMGLPGPI